MFSSSPKANPIGFSATAPQRHSATAPQRHSATAPPLRARITNFLRAASLMMLLMEILVSGCSPRAGLADPGSPNQVGTLPPTLLQPSTSHIDFGTVAPSEHKETTVWLCNKGTKIVEVAEISTSCDCFEVMLEKKILLPGEKTKAKMKVDFAHEPNFTGSLGLRAEGVAKTGGELAFVLSVEVVVK